MPLRIATWNVNSIRRRLDAVIRWLGSEEPDVLCLQETKCTEHKFPRARFASMGYSVSVVGQPGYNGVAILSRAPQIDVDRRPLRTASLEARGIAATIAGLRVLNVYVPYGAAVGTSRFDAKLRWLDQLAGVLRGPGGGTDAPPDLVCGDFNVAPDDRDVYDPVRRREKLICSTPERERFHRLIEDGTYADAFRERTEEPGHYTWWSHRVGAVERNRGLRVDHHLVRTHLVGNVRSVSIDIAERKRAGASDHAPMTLSLR